MTSQEALRHPFLTREGGNYDNNGKGADLGPTVRKNYGSKRSLHAAIDTIREINKLREQRDVDTSSADVAKKQL